MLFIAYLWRCQCYVGRVCMESFIWFTVNETRWGISFRFSTVVWLRFLKSIDIFKTKLFFIALHLNDVLCTWILILFLIQFRKELTSSGLYVSSVFLYKFLKKISHFTLIFELAVHTQVIINTFRRQILVW